MKFIIVTLLVFIGIIKLIQGAFYGDEHQTVIGMLDLIFSNQIMDKN